MALDEHRVHLTALGTSPFSQAVEAMVRKAEKLRYGENREAYAKTIGFWDMTAMVFGRQFDLSKGNPQELSGQQAELYDRWSMLQDEFSAEGLVLSENIGLDIEALGEALLFRFDGAEEAGVTLYSEGVREAMAQVYASFAKVNLN